MILIFIIKYVIVIIKKIPIIQFLYLSILKLLISMFLLIYPNKKYGKNVIILEAENTYPISLQKPAKSDIVIEIINIYI